MNKQILNNVSQINIHILTQNNVLTKKMLALYYFKYYDKQFIDIIYNKLHGYKKSIIEKYKTKYTNNPSRYDLYFLLKKIPISDVMTIGW